MGVVLRMQKGLKKQTLQEWRLLTIYDLGRKGGTRREIDDELKRKLLLLKFSDREIDAQISIGWNWTELENKTLSLEKGGNGD